jgi:hypothetical protein
LQALADLKFILYEAKEKAHLPISKQAFILYNMLLFRQ